MDENKPGAPSPENDAMPTPETPEPSEGGADSDALRSAEVEALRQELDETKQAMLRALAEAENVRRRAQRDVSDARQYAVTSFARELLTVADNFKRALHTVDGTDTGGLPEPVQGLLDGVRMTERELNAVFERHGIRVIDPTGERFDPNRHQAMFEIENAEVASGTVLQVVQPGAMIGERVLRPAMVGVSKGGPKARPQAEATAGAQADGAGAADSGGEGGE